MALGVKEAMAEPMWVTQYGGSDGYCGLVTASGETYDCGAYTAASPYLAFGTLVRITYAGNSTVVRVNDRCGECSLDLSLAAGTAIGLPGADLAEVEVL